MTDPQHQELIFLLRSHVSNEALEAADWKKYRTSLPEETFFSIVAEQEHMTIAENIGSVLSGNPDSEEVKSCARLIEYIMIHASNGEQVAAATLANLLKGKDGEALLLKLKKSISHESIEKLIAAAEFLAPDFTDIKKLQEVLARDS